MSDKQVEPTQSDVWDRLQTAMRESHEQEQALLATFRKATKLDNVDLVFTTAELEGVPEGDRSPSDDWRYRDDDDIDSDYLTEEEQATQFSQHFTLPSENLYL